MSGLEKTIYLARHAKSAWDTGAASDYERPLSKRGQKDVRRVAEELSKRNWAPQKIIASPALRAQQTSEILCEGFGADPDSIFWNKDIYMAYTISLLHILSNQHETTNSVMLVGHNPSMEELLIHLCGIGVCNKYRQANGKLFTTGNVAKITVSVPWKGLVMYEAQLDGLIRPKEI